jgi:hypothetical protein
MPSKHTKIALVSPAGRPAHLLLLAHAVAKHGIDRRFDERGMGTLAPLRRRAT